MSSDDLKFEIDGPEVHQRTVNAEAALELFASYLALVRRAAEERGTQLAFHGLEVEEKCLRIASLPTDSIAALVGARDVSAMLARQSAVPESLQKSIQSFRKLLKNFPQKIERTTVQVGQSERLGLDVSWSEPQVGEFLETFSGRAVVTRVGGKRPTVRLSSRLELKEMTLDADKDLARRIASFLYKEVEIDARVKRDKKGAIIGGELLNFEEVRDEDPTQAWRDFFRTAGDEWGELSADEMNEEIGRG